MTIHNDMIENTSMETKLSAPSFINSIKGNYVSTLEENFQFNKKDLANKNIILYFYPKDDTPGCTTQAIDFRNLYKDFSTTDTIILGVSRDDLKSHNNFTKKYALPFNLICDTSEELCKQFDVIKDKKMYGKLIRGIQRSTFFFNKEGKLVKEWRNVKASNHAEKLLNMIKNNELS